MQTGMWQVFRYLLELNFFIVGLGLILSAILGFAKWKPELSFNYRILLKFFYALAVMLLFAPLLPELDQGEEFTRPFIQTFTSESGWEAGMAAVPVPVMKFSDPALVNLNQWGFLNLAVYILILFTILGAAYFMLLCLRSHRQIKQLQADSLLLKSHRGVKLFLSPETSSPFSFHNLKDKLIFIPQNLIEHRTHFNIALKHELQHHRQKDTQFVYLMDFLKYGFFYNPASWLLHAQLGQLQELACDQALLEDKHIKPQHYANCLLAVAEHQMKDWQRTVGTTGLSFSAHLLKRRIINMKNHKISSPWFMTMLMLASLIFSISFAYAGKGIVKSHGLSLEQAQALIGQTSSSESIPLYVDAQVLKWLNMGIGTERGRLFAKASLKRMQQYQDMIKTQLKKHELPEELLAVPLHESGYQNFDNGIAAGIWSFVPQTARNFGLRVDHEVDERFDAQKLTVAAMKYYIHMMKLKPFEHNWYLALLAYNAGEHAVMKAIDEVGSTDALELIKKSTHLKQENREYLPRFMAYLIIMKHPELLD